MGLLLSILIGLLAGYLGSLIFKGSGLGLFWNLVVGLIGGIIGGAVFEFLGLTTHGLIWQLISATAGAIILLWIVSLLRKK
ncbi:MAG: hypothetical protein PWQ17_1742 [Anaerophaga sp.]|uniref:GlsB/YeaQ/YmgE family stress response membrane protein n=1 Tax=Anaerophaga thermohalophila TaxID=177400 RepID=UPI000237C858|nr:GlsB/YeaQ/YmgE family stress response membrane protein [Anaerophaga thermohalophila]MDK2842237.1 hypothetical protein [Anaerophaga sp.]MDN5291155.1 hypothetical protein [Anaerophaga sp.]